MIEIGGGLEWRRSSRSVLRTGDQRRACWAMRVQIDRMASTVGRGRECSISNRHALTNENHRPYAPRDNSSNRRPFEYCPRSGGKAARESDEGKDLPSLRRLQRPSPTQRCIWRVLATGFRPIIIRRSLSC
jgi:hypothetical protein